MEMASETTQNSALRTDEAASHGPLWRLIDCAVTAHANRAKVPVNRKGEILGNGTWMGITIIPESIDRMSLMNQAPGGFFVFGCLMALCVYIEKKLNKPIERKTCGDVMLEEIDKAKTEEGGAKE